MAIPQSRFRAEVTGADEVLRSIRRLGAAGVEVGKRVLGRKTLEILSKARPNTPVDEVDGGDLRDSGRVTKPVKTAAGRISAGVVFGGAPLRRAASEKGKKLPGIYAVMQHEDLTLRHASGEAKWLEKAGNAVAPTVPDEMLAELDREANR